MIFFLTSLGTNSSLVCRVALIKLHWMVFESMNSLFLDNLIYVQTLTTTLSPGMFHNILLLHNKQVWLGHKVMSGHSSSRFSGREQNLWLHLLQQIMQNLNNPKPSHYHYCVFLLFMWCSFCRMLDLRLI